MRTVVSQSLSGGITHGQQKYLLVHVLLMPNLIFAGSPLLSRWIQCDNCKRVLNWACSNKLVLHWLCIFIEPVQLWYHAHKPSANITKHRYVLCIFFQDDGYLFLNCLDDVTPGHSVSCDVCLRKGVLAPRFHCMVCRDFDICMSCWWGKYNPRSGP